MKTKIVKYATIPVLILLLAVLATGCKKEVVKDSTEVWMEGMSFAPRTLTVDVNSTVKWTNKDDMTHNVVSDDGLFDSGIMNTDEVFMRKFTEVGIYNYTCTLHPGMVGTIIVRQQQSSTY